MYGVAPIYEKFSENVLRFPFSGLKTFPKRPKRVLFPEPFGPIIILWESFLIVRSRFSNI